MKILLYLVVVMVFGLVMVTNVKSEEVVWAQLVIPARAELGEGSIWDNQRKLLYWIDIDGRQFYVYNPSVGSNSNFKLNEIPGTVVPRLNAQPGEVVIALQSGIYSYNYITQEKYQLAKPETVSTNRMNDGKCDPRGRFWVGSMSLKNGQPREASLYRIDSNKASQRVLSNVGISNGVTWSLDGRVMYYIDTSDMGVDRFDYDVNSGSATNRRRVITFTGQFGFPDGMTIDSEGKLWIAHYDGSRVTRWDPNNGQLLLTVMVPVRKVTSVAFGGDDLSTLYITTARAGEEAKGGGGLFQVKFNGRFKGVDSYSFAG
ncbi:senescence marker protein-30 family protein [Cavenderia fasciculata]|uniref:Senescence marker protein-30 family protein n=1 Tax=Cavenderia fasciculata TaxID=261658 RepID=F4Q328_CACFS|nr:senescence marker protein-30 family protein [Cavenderia fasciculata]EGG16750.1 senescence marker protein-30 family protein [Cavenderia fasciculata]|eukprot:XP_004355224.1 senescence marker protein-30 family protein [Cavenderia fasciculata]